MLLVSGGDAVGFGEIKAAQQVDAFGHLLMAARHLAITCRDDQRAVKGFVQRAHPLTVVESCIRRPQPD